MLVISSFFIGCAQYYYQEGKSFDECKQDRVDCYAELEKRVEVVTASDYEFKFMKECMRQKGYKIVTEDKLPLDVKRHRPDRSLNWFVRGIAGELDE
jgi:hypothetical protein